MISFIHCCLAIILFCYNLVGQESRQGSTGTTHLCSTVLAGLWAEAGGSRLALHMTRASGLVVSWHFSCPSCDLSLFSRIIGTSLHSSYLPKVQIQKLQVTASSTPFNWSINVTEPIQVQMERKLSWEEWQSHIAKDMQNGRNCVVIFGSDLMQT